MDFAIEADDLVKRYGAVTALDGFSLRVRRGEVLGLLGPNGAGKSTFVECAVGLRTPDAGRVRTLGLAPGRELRSRVGVHPQPVGKLSGGEQQRLFLALALLHEPELVVLDELTTGLDPEARRGAWQLVRALREDGLTVVLVTHDVAEAAALCDRVAIVSAGRLVACGTPDELGDLETAYFDLVEEGPSWPVLSAR